MADEEKTSEEVQIIEEFLADAELRVGVSSNEFMGLAVRAICGQNVTAAASLGGQRMKLHTGDPGLTGANPAGGSYAAAPISQAVTWSTVPTTSVGGLAVITGTVPAFSVPAATETYSHYGIYNGNGVFLYGKQLSSTITVSAGQTATITVTAQMTYDIN